MQAPKTRRDERRRPDRRALWLLLAAVVVAAAIGAAAYFLLRGEDQSAQATMEEAGCTFRRFPAAAGGVHINNPDATPDEWNSFPPTSGPHFGQWVLWGEYEEPVQLARAVHNLEHGGIVIYYGRDVPEDEVEALRGFYRGDPNAILLAPLPRLRDKIALTAWVQPLEEDGEEIEGGGYLAECTRFDEDAFEAFRDEYRYKGPERIPPDDLEPGE